MGKLFHPVRVPCDVHYLMYQINRFKKKIQTITCPSELVEPQLKYVLLLVTSFNSPTFPVDILVYRLAPPTNTGPIHSTIDTTGETGQTVFRLQWDTNFPVSSNHVRHVGCMHSPNKVTQPQSGVISLSLIPQIRNSWFETTNGRPCWGHNVEKRWSAVKRGFTTLDWKQS